jgi:hypothetical protein
MATNKCHGLSLSELRESMQPKAVTNRSVPLDSQSLFVRRDGIALLRAAGGFPFIFSFSMGYASLF